MKALASSNRRCAAFVAAFVLVLCTAGTACAQQASAGTGYLAVVADVDSLFVVVDGDFAGAHAIAGRDTVALPAGEHVITLASRFAVDHVFRAPIEADIVFAYPIALRRTPVSYGDHLRLSSFPALHTGMRLIVYTDADSEVWLDGRRLGTGGLQIDTLAGTYTITTRHRHAGSRRRRVVLQDDPPRLRVLALYNKPRADVSYLLSVVPGASQWYQNEPLKAVLAAGAVSAGLVLGGVRHLAFRRERGRLADLKADYAAATTEAEALRLGDAADAAYAGVRDHAASRDRFLRVALGFYAVQLVDAWLRPAGGYRGAARPYDFRLAPTMRAGGAGFSLNVRW